MSKITVKLVQKKRHATQTGDIPIYLRLTRSRKVRLISSGIKVAESDWNANKEIVRKSHPSFTSINNALHKLKRKAEELVYAGCSVNEVIDSITTKGQGTTLADLIKKHHKHLEDEGDLFESKQILVLERQLSKYRTTQVSDIDPAFIKKVIREFKGHGNSNNTINKKLKRLKRLLKTGEKQRDNSTFDWFSSLYLKSESTEVVRLTRDQILAIESLESLDRSLEKTRDCFLFSYFNAGIRFSDLCRLRWDNIIDGRLVYKMSKTGTYKNIKLLSKSLGILDSYSKAKSPFIFDMIPDGLNPFDEKKKISSVNALYNKRLKKLARLAGIEASISSHTARHSFADFARKSNMNLYDISKALGHSDISITKEYLASFDETSLDESMENLFK